MRRGFCRALGLMALASCGSILLADAPPPKPDEHTEKICRRILETGSRLRTNKVCMTRAEWAEQRRQDRMLIERSQMQACTPGAGC